MLIRLIITLAITSVGGSSDLILADDTEQSLVCTYEDACPKDIIVRTTVGYGISVLVKDVDIDGENGDFLLIKSGTQILDGLNGVTFTYNIDHERKYISLTNEVLIRFHVNKRSNEDSTHTGFALSLRRFDRKDEKEFNNFPHLNSHLPSITVNMKMLEPFNETLFTFRETVANMGQDYVDNENGFNLVEPISEDDVQVILIIPCPIHWPNTRTCYQITFALPILLSEDSYYYGSYQLNEHHLQLMWKNATYFFNEENTPTITIYTQHNYQFVPWIITISVFIAIFGITYLVIGFVCSRIIIQRRMKRQEQEENARHSVHMDDKDEIYNLDLSPFQTVPPLFNNDVTYFDPDRRSSAAPRRITNQHDHLDDNLLNIRNIQFFNPKDSSTA